MKKKILAIALTLFFSASVVTVGVIAADNNVFASTEMPHGDKDKDKKKDCCKAKTSKECTKEEAAKCHSDKKSCCSAKEGAAKAGCSEKATSK